MIYGIIHIKGSIEYTNLAVKSFLKNTVINTTDRFVVIDNDHSYSNEPFVIKNDTPRTFSQNANKLLSFDDDVCILNNDIYFPPQWNDFQINCDEITIPCCNQTHPFTVPPSCSIDYITDFAKIDHKVKTFTSSKRSKFSLPKMPFYAVFIPKQVYNKVGLFDENFDCGGEDIDYRIRASKFGIKTIYNPTSYLIHFHGKSTWDGNETKIETETRNRKYTKAFANKYGDTTLLFPHTAIDFDLYVREHL